MTRLTGVLVLNRRIRNRTHGGVVGRGEPLLLPDKLHWEIRPPVEFAKNSSLACQG